MKTTMNGFAAFTICSLALPLIASAAESSAGEDLVDGRSERLPGAGVADESANSRRRARALEEIIVTAQRRNERLEDVPVSISVLGGDELDAASAESLNDALVRVPGVYGFDSHQNGGTKFSVRGVTSNGSQFNGASTVGYYLEEIPFGFVKFASSPDANAYDLERVEVLRGPQGTLYGASALNGVIRIVTADADLNDFGFKTRASTSTTEGGGGSYRGDAAINVPLVAGKLGARATVGYADLGGYIDQPAIGRTNANSSELKSLRLKINAKPVDNLSVELMTWFNRDDFGAPSTGNEQLINVGTIDQPISRDYDALGLVADYAFSWGNLLSATSYMKFESTGVLDIGPGVATLETDIMADTFSEEIRLTSNQDGSLRWSLGGIYREEDDGFFQSLVPIFARSGGPLESQSYALFGEATYSFGGRLDLSAGLRYFEDRVTQRTTLDDGAAPVEPLNIEARFDSLTPRAVLAWHPTERSTIYASYSQGFRSGFPVDPSGVTSLLGPGAEEFVQPVHEDLLTNYEIGMKGSVLDGRISLDSSAYYIDWDDAVQVVAVNILGGAASVTIPINSEGISGFGADVGVSAEVTKNLTLGASLSWNDLAFDKDVVSSTATSSTVLYREGARPPESPKETIGAFASYAMPLSGGYELELSTSAAYNSRVSISNGRGGLLMGEEFRNIAARISFVSPFGWTMAVFGENLANENPVLRPQSVPNFESRVRPRTVGLQFEYRYGR
jgi:iron complex outermembrane recepter protein